MSSKPPLQTAWTLHLKPPWPAGRIARVDRLKADGWRVESIYLALPSVELSHQRVAERVAHGGHDIPAADIARRFPRSLHNLLEVFASRVDHVSYFMISGTVPERVFEQIVDQRTAGNRVRIV
jgi:predicted ABC-type ATPase